MIGFFVISNHLGGAERSLLDLLEELQSSKDQFLVILPKKDGPLVEKLNNLGIKTHSLEIPSWYLKVSRKNKLYTLLGLIPLFLYSVFLILKIRRLIKNKNFQTIHSTGLKFHLLLGFVAFLSRKPRFILHIRDIIHSSLLRSLFSLVARSSRIKFIANSKLTQKSLQPVSSQLIYNGFRAAPSGSSELKQKLKIPNGHFLIGLVAVIARWKGQREFIQMADLLMNDRKDCHFVIVGSEIYDTGSETGELSFLKSLVAQSKNSERIHFLPFQKNIFEVYRDLDILVHSSIEPEPFGRVVIEAMSCQVPVTASDQGGPLEIIELEKSGLLHKAGDPQNMKENVERLLNDSSLRNSIIHGALERSSYFSMENYAQKMATELGLKYH